LEAAEVKSNFDEHNLDVDEKAITKLFKSVAMNRKRLDPCNELSLYEFAIFSKKSTEDFQALMNNIKAKMLKSLAEKEKERQNNNGIKDVDQIVPERQATYFKCLPSSFNPLMNHFKDEEKRTNLRTDLQQNLADIIKPKDRNKLDVEILLKNNGEKMKELIESHFPPEENNEQSRRLFTQAKKASEGFKRLKEKVRGIFALQKRQNINLDNMPMEFLENEENQITDINTLREKTKRELSTIIQTARKLGQKEAKRLIQKQGNRIDNRIFTALDARNSACSKIIRTGRPLNRALTDLKARTSLLTDRSAKTDYEKKLLGENLILRTTISNNKLINSGSISGLSSNETWTGPIKENQLPEASDSKTISNFEGMSKNFRIRDVVIKKKPQNIHIRTFSAAEL